MGVEFLNDLTPGELGLGQFDRFRDIQLEAIEQAVYGGKRFQALALPTGAGKSLVAVGIHRVSQWRMCGLTATKGLQDQYQREFKSSGLVDVRGKANYDCSDVRLSGLSCRDGQKGACSWHEPGKYSSCVYDQVKRKARNADITWTNYDYWMSINAKGRGLERIGQDEVPNPFECLVLDEGHKAPDELADFLAVRLYEKELRDLLGEDGIRTDSIKDWQEFANDNLPEVELQRINLERVVAERGPHKAHKELELVHRFEKLEDKLAKIGGVGSADSADSEWICEMREGQKYGRSWEFDVVWPGKYAEQYLFKGISRVVIMSATLRPKTMSLLGIGKDEYEFVEWPRVFPANRNPTYYYPMVRENGKAVQFNYRSSEEDLKGLVEHMDEILDSRSDRKCIVHSVSYQRQRYIINNSRHSDRMIGNLADPDSDDAMTVYKAYVESTEPKILVSPSFGTGWDFPGKSCEVVIIPKIPFPNGQGKVMKARRDRDDSYLNYIAMQELVQASGRGMRFEMDRCEVFILDGSWIRFKMQSSSLAPRWYVNSVREIMRLPELPEKLK